MVLGRLFRRVFRRRPDQQATERMIELLAQRSVRATASEQFQDIAQALPIAPGSRVKVVLDIDDPTIAHLLVTSIGGNTELSGRMSLIGAHLLVERAALGLDWPSSWSGAVRAQPIESRSGVGPPRDFEWRPADQSDTPTAEAARRLGANERIQRRVVGLLREPSTLLFEIVPTGERLRIAVHQSARELPDPTAVDALITVARALADGSAPEQ